MTPLLLILAALILNGLFFALTSFEARRGVRFFEAPRAKFDAHIERLMFIVQHVDFAAFLRDEVKRLAKRITHDFIHFTLQGIRAVERVLTRLVKHLRSRDPMQSVARESSRPFIGTLSAFKTELAATRPSLSQISEQIG